MIRGKKNGNCLKLRFSPFEELITIMSLPLSIIKMVCPLFLIIVVNLIRCNKCQASKDVADKCSNLIKLYYY